MDPLIAYCGLDCASCEARTATLRNDDAMRTRVAQQWSELNQVEIRPSDICCLGCRTEGVKSVYCDRLCPIRQCALSRAVYAPRCRTATRFIALPTTPRKPSATCPAPNSLLVVVRLTAQDSHRTVDLLYKKQAYHLVTESHSAQRYFAVGTRIHAFGEPVWTAYR